VGLITRPEFYRVCVCVCVCMTRLASNEIFSPSNKIHRQVGRAKDLSAEGWKLKLRMCIYKISLDIEQVKKLWM
jgi:hypothetical protein